MPPTRGELQLLQPQLRGLKKRKEGLRNIVGNRRLKFDELFTADFRRQAAIGSLEIAEFLKESGIDSVGFNSVGSLNEIDRELLDQHVATKTRYSSWSDLLADAVADWVRRRIESELPAKASYTINRSRPKVRTTPLNPSSGTTHSIPDSSENQLFKDGIGFEIEEHITVAGLFQLPEWVSEWANEQKLSIHLSEWKTADLLHLKEAWAEAYKDYPRFYPKSLAKNPSEDIRKPYGNAVWHFDLRFFDQELDRSTLPIFGLFDGVSQRPKVVDEDSEWTTDDLWLFAKTAVLEIAIATTATVIIGGIVVVSAPVAITVTGSLIVYGLTTSAAERFDKGQTSIQIVGGSIADISGVNNVWSLIADQDIATGEKLNLSRDERTQRFASVATVFVSPATPKLTKLGGQIGKRVEPVVHLASSKVIEYNAKQFRRILSGAADLRAFVDPNERIFVATLAEFAEELNRRTRGTAYSGPGIIFEVPAAFLAAIQKVRSGGNVSFDDILDIGAELGVKSISRLDVKTAIPTIKYLAENIISDEGMLMDLVSQYIIKNTDDLTKRKHRGGKSEAAQIGDEVHQREADIRRQSGGFASVNQVLRDDSGIDIVVPRGGHEIPRDSRTRMGYTTVKPDAIDRANKRVVDEKPDDGDMHSFQMSEYIVAYYLKYDDFPESVVLRRYEVPSRRIIKEDVYKPEDYGFFRPYRPPRIPRNLE